MLDCLVAPLLPRKRIAQARGSTIHHVDGKGRYTCHTRRGLTLGLEPDCRQPAKAAPSRLRYHANDKLRQASHT